MPSECSLNRPVPRWLHIWAILTVIATALLLALGGLVTTFRVGMADPIWPTTPWFLFFTSWSEPRPGFLIEHSHRLAGYVVGCFTIVLTVGMLATARTCGLKKLGILCLFAVIAQGMLGGFRVVLNELMGPNLAIIHGCFAQIVFSLLVAAAVLTATPAGAFNPPQDDRQRYYRIARLLVGIIFLQLIWGALVRHNPSPLVQRLHLITAFAVIGTAVWTIKTCQASPQLWTRLREPAFFLRYSRCANIVWRRSLDGEIRFGDLTGVAKNHARASHYLRHSYAGWNGHSCHGGRAGIVVASTGGRCPVRGTAYSEFHSGNPGSNDAGEFASIGRFIVKTVELASEQAGLQRLADYVQLTRPRIGVMALFTVAVGFLLASGSEIRSILLFHTLLGTALVASAASAINQWQERKADARMKRTANRPLPGGRIHPVEALLFGLLLATTGIAYLLLALPTVSAAIVAAVTLVTYLGLYTPMKPLSIWNTVVGAFPGALPPVIGWCAARGTISLEAISLFLIPVYLATASLFRHCLALPR